MIVIGAPVFERAWILERWFAALAAQEGYPPETLSILLNLGGQPSTDGTVDVVLRWKYDGPFAEVATIASDVPNQTHRAWDLPRYEVMARLRNDMLTIVRGVAPDYYLSCDTDMLLPSNTLRTLVPILEEQDFDGVAPLAYMTKIGTDSPNAMSHVSGMRPILNHKGTTQQWAVFGTVLMNKTLYGVDYAPASRGEDIGWAENVQARRLRLALCPEVVVKHVMEPELLDVVDPRVGF